MTSKIAIFLFSILVGTQLLADQLYLCNGTYQDHPCAAGQKGEELKNLPQISVSGSAQSDAAAVQENTMPDNAPPSGDTPGNAQRAPAQPTDQFVKLQEEIKQFSATPLNLKVDKEGFNAVDVELTRIRTQIDVACSPVTGPDDPEPSPQCRALWKEVEGLRTRLERLRPLSD